MLTGCANGNLDVVVLKVFTGTQTSSIQLACLNYLEFQFPNAVQSHNVVITLNTSQHMEAYLTQPYHTVQVGVYMTVNFTGQILTICLSCQLTTLRGAILEDAIPSTARHGTARGLPLKEVLEYVIPELNIQCLRLAMNSPKVAEQLLKLDEQGVNNTLRCPLEPCFECYHRFLLLLLI